MPASLEEVDPGVDVDALFLDVDDEGVQLGAVDQVEEAVEIVPVVHGRVEVDRLGRELIGGGVRRGRESRAQPRRAGKGRSGEPLQRPAPREGRSRTASRTGAHPVVPHVPVPLFPRGLRGRLAAQHSPVPRRSSVPAVLTTEVLAFKQIVTAATHVLVANKLPISRLRDLLLDVFDAPVSETMIPAAELVAMVAGGATGDDGGSAVRLEAVLECVLNAQQPPHLLSDRREHVLG